MKLTPSGMPDSFRVYDDDGIWLGTVRRLRPRTRQWTAKDGHGHGHGTATTPEKAAALLPPV